MPAFIFSLVCIMLLANTTNHCFKFINSKNYVVYSSFIYFFFFNFNNYKLLSHINIYNIVYLFNWNNSIAFI